MTFPHGTPQGYWKGCHDKCCLDADREDRAKKRAAKHKARNWDAALTLVSHDTMTREEYRRVRGA